MKNDKLDSYTKNKVDDKTNVYLKNSIFKDLILCALNQVANENLYTNNSFDFFPNDLVITQIEEKKFKIDFSINIWHKVDKEKIFQQIKDEINSATMQEFPSYELDLNMVCKGNED